ncbi:MAG: hypothetical protein V8R40_11415 [Dysosmobacter sp.]
MKIGFSEAAKEITMEEQFESYLRTLQIPDEMVIETPGAGCVLRV